MNSALKKLGFSEQDRVVIIHTDDIGMCQATIPAYAGLIEAGLISSASTMVPCSWFPAAAQFCREHPSVDMGVHLTLNAEWDTYRWGPISTRDPKSGLLDEQGYFFSNTASTMRSADPAAVAIELKAQLDRALASGIDVTHVDSHMGTVMTAPFFELYLNLALEYRLPAFLLKSTAANLHRFGADSDLLKRWADLTSDLEERGVTFFDQITMLPLDDPNDNVGIVKHTIDNLQPGLTYMILHPSVDTPELRSCAPDWPSRVANYEALSNPELLDYVKQSGVQVIGYRPIRDLLRNTVVA